MAHGCTILQVHGWKEVVNLPVENWLSSELQPERARRGCFGGEPDEIRSETFVISTLLHSVSDAAQMTQSKERMVVIDSSPGT